ncbi:3-dehydroquinate synthase [Romboutsia ilealis]|uniref:3-dehydroquinate synthase n=1 Tax=Romboutsia ilealis TaxID=1115758 RepID=A0A1V1I313_9FIRM|nr:3-dehydroquinate synthase [Romboutsia ilealis]CED94631.1 3-dehydroquinate synthase [Romboutsia ilealis]
MEKIINEVCNIVIDNSYKNFTTLVYEFNNKNIENLSKFNINEIYDEVLIISDENVYNHQLDNFINNIKAKIVYEYIIPSGEDSKSLSVYEEIIKYCIRINLSRKSLIIALGGGVVGDLAGFVASTYMRGIDVCQVPTSLLSQVDSSVGGKTGINIGNFKNIIGAFYQPKFTYINIDALKTLSYNEFIAGMAEVIKYSIIYDYDFLDYLINNSENILNKDNKTLHYMVKKCIEIKADIVSKDEKEGNLRKILNFGHTFGHGVEKLCKISHGEAISIGMNMAFKLALEKGYINGSYYDKFINACDKFNLPLNFNISLYEKDEITEESKDKINKEILEIMKNDKKNSFGKINLILPIGFGKVKIIDDIDDGEILKIIKEVNNA